MKEVLLELIYKNIILVFNELSLSQPGSATKFPFAVGSVYWRGGYGREAEIIGSGGVTVSHGAPGSSESKVQAAPASIAPAARPSVPEPTSTLPLKVSSISKPMNQTVALAPEKKRADNCSSTSTTTTNNCSSIPATIFTTIKYFTVLR